MNTERLKLASTMLREVEAGTWKVSNKKAQERADESIRYDKGAEFNLRHWLDEPGKVGCGFSACAVGHMTLDSRFNEQGLVMDWDWGTEGAPMLEQNYTNPNDNPHSWDAVRSFFDLSDQEADSLFRIDHYVMPPTAGQVADRIDALIARLEWIPESRLAK